MQCRVLKLGYDEKGKPVVPGADQKHGVVRCDRRWWQISRPAVHHIHPLLCYAWEEASGLFGVFADSQDWPLIDPANVGVSLPKYFAANTDWLSCRYDGNNADLIFFSIEIPEVPGKGTLQIVNINVAKGDVISAGEEVFTVCRGQVTRTVTCPSSGQLIEIYDYSGTGTELVSGLPLIKLSRKESVPVIRRKIQLTEKPLSTPTIQDPLVIGDSQITRLYPSVYSTIGTNGDRISEAESG